MSNISGVGGAVPMTTMPSVNSGAALDGETILLYCQSQLNDLGSEIKAKMAEQRANREQKELLTDLRNTLSKYSQTKIDTLDYDAKMAILSKYAAALSKMPPGPARDAVMSSFNAFRSSGCHNNQPAPPTDLATYATKGIHDDLNVKESPDGAPDDNGLNKEEVQDRMKDLEAAGDELGKDAELGMIDLQQLISQRQMAIQMATNMMSKYSQGLEGIVGNLAK